MRTAIGATAVNIAKPTNLGVPMIHAFLDNIRYITIELNGLTLYDTRDDVPCDMDKWRETRARFPARWPVVRLKRPTSETPGRRSEPHPFAKVGLSQKFVSEITFSNLRFCTYESRRRRQWTHGWATNRLYTRLDRRPDS